MSRWVLMGAGEFEPWHDDIDRRSVGEGRVVIAPAAAAHEGEETFGKWAAKGLAHYERLGIDAAVLPVRTREDAERDDVAAMLDDASVLFVSGGNPWRLSEILRGTPLWDRITERIRDGLVYTGCSAGVACLTERTFDSDEEEFERIFKPGLGHVRRTLFAPHWDTVDDWVPGARAFIAGSVPAGETLIGLDERTAMVGDGSSWEVIGSGGIHVMLDGVWDHHAPGTSFELRLDRA